jgi:predicted Zn-dependent protease
MKRDADLPSADRHHLQAAEGWLELGDHQEAHKELEQITADSRAHPDVLELRWQIDARARQWAACVDTGRSLIQLAPERAASWIHYAFALHELKRTQEAWEALSSVAQKFPADPTIPYNLACYACQLGDLVGARDWLAQAFRLGNAKEIKSQAISDPDLAPLWKSQDST